MATYYVDDDGDNGNSGTADDSAWATLDYADTQVSAGDIVYAMNGTYNEYWTMTHGGSVGNRVYWYNYPGHTPVFPY